MSRDKVKIKIQNSQGDTETVWADPLGDNKYKLDSSPFFAYGISWQDIVEAYPVKDGMLEFKKVIEKSGHKTVRVISEDEKISDEFIDQITSMGCSIEQANEKFFIIDIPKDVKFKKIIDFVSNSSYDWEHADPTYEEINGLD